MTSTLFKLGSLCVLRSRPLISKRSFHVTSVRLAAYDAEFNQAKDRLGSLKTDPGNQVKLKIYGLFKQATTGACSTPKPGMMDFVGKAKWEAWSGLGSMSQDDAQKAYIELVDSLVEAEGGSTTDSGPAEATASSSTSPSASSSSQDLLVENRDGMCILTMNRPDKKNAITRAMYYDFQNALNAADKDDSVKLLVLTGAGNFYSSGNDLRNLTELHLRNLAEEARIGGEILREFVAAFINFRKPMIGLVNGPAVGIACTLLGLMDVVYCPDNATFQTPFSNLGISPEACSSYIFPKIMGARAGEMLMFNKKISAGEALERNLVTAVLPAHNFQKEAWALVEVYAKLPPPSLRLIKSLIRDNEKELLLKINRVECNLLVERWQSKECMDAVMSFFSK